MKLLRSKGAFLQQIAYISNSIVRRKATETGQTGFTHFGFETVKESEKSDKVHKVFEDVANSYDVMNDAMSLGIHRLWKDIFISRLAPMSGTKLLDVAGGTGDIAFRFLDYVKNEKLSDCHVTIGDINTSMMDVGQKRAQEHGYDQKQLSWQEVNAEQLPFEDDAFNAYTIAFGIRNCTHIDKVTDEAYRVLKPGGRFMCLEFSHIPNPTMQWMYDLYSFEVIPLMGQLIAGQWKHYQYLVESIRKFPDQESFKHIIQKSGFRQVSYENLTFGVVSIHSGYKL